MLRLYRWQFGCSEVQNPTVIIEFCLAVFLDTVGVAQLAEHRTVAPDVVGSIPITHPIK